MSDKKLELKILGYKERLKEIVAEYEEKVQTLRVEYTLLHSAYKEKEKELEEYIRATQETPDDSPDVPHGHVPED